MIICWDNLDKLQYINGKLRKKTNKGYIYYKFFKICKECDNEYLSCSKTSNFCSKECDNENRKTRYLGEGNPRHGFKHPHLSEWNKNNIKSGSDCSFWKGGYCSNGIPSYSTYAPQIKWCEEVRRNYNDKNILEVKCTYCGKWHIPSIPSVSNRIKAINGKFGKGTEQRMYCSDECKTQCTVYNQREYFKGFEGYQSREVQPELRQLVFERDDWTCQECDQRGGALNCHHIEGIKWNPLESADMNKCMTVCKKCHVEIHKKNECGYNDMKC